MTTGFTGAKLTIDKKQWCHSEFGKMTLTCQLECFSHKVF